MSIAIVIKQTKPRVRAKPVTWPMTLAIIAILIAPFGPVVAHDQHHHAAPSSTKSGQFLSTQRNYSVPDVTLIDMNGQPVRVRELLAANEPVMLNFVFTTCTAICPVMSSIFAQVPPELGSSGGKLRLISISIDPENDTPKQLRAYAKKFDAGPRWQFLTGSKESVVAVQRAFDNFQSDKMGHSPLTFIRSAPEQPWIRVEGFASSKELASEYRKVAYH